jgi:hypothetical protein
VQIINQRLPPILHLIFVMKNRGGIFIRGPVRPVMGIGQTGAMNCPRSEGLVRPVGNIDQTVVTG